jgi:STE24 endopeptidase
MGSRMTLPALLAAAALAANQAAPLVQIAPPPAAASGASGKIDPDAATRAYIDTLPADQRARSNAYFEGSYWTDFWTYVWGVAVFLLLLQTGISARMRDRAERMTRIKPLQTAIYWAQFAIVTTLLFFPYTLYRDHFREHKYGLSNLTLGGFLEEQAKALAFLVGLGAVGMALLYAVVRRLPRTWWVWGAATTIVLYSCLALLFPVFILPAFNTPKILADQRIVAPILTLARANGIKAGEVWEVDASKQSRRMSANVSGLLGTERITLNDNLINRGSLPEIEAVMGHEMGHYVLNHIYKSLFPLGIIFALGFALLSVFHERLRVRNEARWQVRGIGDVAGLPLAALILSTYFMLLTPVINSLVRSAEYEADMYGLNAARQPDGFAQVALHLSEYRKIEPSRLEEIIFFDHPSGRTRIHAAMRWKAEHPEVWSAAAKRDQAATN